jgi:hypothetical protein
MHHQNQIPLLRIVRRENASAFYWRDNRARQLKIAFVEVDGKNQWARLKRQESFHVSSPSFVSASKQKEHHAHAPHQVTDVIIDSKHRVKKLHKDSPQLSIFNESSQNLNMKINDRPTITTRISSGNLPVGSKFAQHLAGATM